MTQQQIERIAPCVFHDERHDECVQHSGQAPCMTQTESDRLAGLLADRDAWRRVAERLEREKIALAQDVLSGRDRRIAQAEALEAAANDCVPDMHQMSHWLRGRAEQLRRAGSGRKGTTSGRMPPHE